VCYINLHFTYLLTDDVPYVMNVVSSFSLVLSERGSVNLYSSICCSILG